MAHDEPAGKRSPSIANRLAIAGAVIGAAVPLTHGLWTYHDLRSLSPPLAGCGTAVLAAVMEMVIVAPLGCAILAAAGWFVGTMFEKD